MSQDWDFFFRTVADTTVGGVRSAAIFADLALRDRPPETVRPVVVRVAVPMRSPRPDGLGDESEADALYAIEDDLFRTLARGARAFADWHLDAAGRLADNLSEYLREERPLLLGRPQLDDLAAAAGQFEADLAALEARVRRLG